MRPTLVLSVCPPPCVTGERCAEKVTCTPETCPYGQQGWQHTAHCVEHVCAHDFESGPVVEFDGGASASCACGMTAVSHDMRYAP